MTIQIETKFSVGDTVFFIEDEKIKFGVIYKMDVTIDKDGQSIYLYTRDGNNSLSVMRERKAFISREQLIQAL